MKKLMFAAAVAAMGTAVMAAGIESANIVGYAQSGLQTGFTMATPQFLNIGSDEMPLQSIFPTGEDTSDNVYIQTLTAGGLTLNSYSWNDWAYDEPCWVNDDYEKIEGVTFAAGQGLWVQATSLNQGIQSAGQVGEEDVTVTLKAGFTATGNPFPMPMNLQDIVVEGNDTSDNVYIQTLTAGGLTLNSYSWNDWACDEPCWVNDDYEKVEGVTFAPGAGLWIQGPSGEQYIRFPAPEL